MCQQEANSSQMLLSYHSWRAAKSQERERRCLDSHFTASQVSVRPAKARFPRCKSIALFHRCQLAVPANLVHLSSCCHMLVVAVPSTLLRREDDSTGTRNLGVQGIMWTGGLQRASRHAPCLPVAHVTHGRHSSLFMPTFMLMVRPVG